MLALKVDKCTQNQDIARSFDSLGTFQELTLANTASAQKRARQSERRRQHNKARRSMMRTHIKQVVRAIDAGDKAKAESAYKAAVPVIDTMAGKGLIHKNKANRHKSRLNARIKEMQASA